MSVKEQEIPLSLVDDNPYNARTRYDELDISRLAESLRTNGMLSPIKVRSVKERYQIVYGHRRVRAVRHLNHERIKAEVGSFSDEEMLRFSLIENVERKELSDFEKARCFVRMEKEFGLSCSEIARIVGYSRQHISNLVHMTELFDKDALTEDPSLYSDLHKISEHHARLLDQIKDRQTRINTLRLVIAQSLSVRDLERMIHKLRGWFGSDCPADELDTIARGFDGKQVNASDADDLDQIKQVLIQKFRLATRGDISTAERLQIFDKDFSLYSLFPPLEMNEGTQALSKLREYFANIAPRLSPKIGRVKVSLSGAFALVTSTIRYNGNFDGRTTDFRARGTVVLVKRDRQWRILHEHWSVMDGIPPLRLHDVSVPALRTIATTS